MSDEIIDLQTRLSFQDSLLEEFDNILTNQQQQIIKLETTLKVLKSQVKSLQSAQPETGQQQHEIPPHY